MNNIEKVVSKIDKAIKEIEEVSNLSFEKPVEVLDSEKTKAIIDTMIDYWKIEKKVAESCNHTFSLFKARHYIDALQSVRKNIFGSEKD